MKNQICISTFPTLPLINASALSRNDFHGIPERTMKLLVGTQNLQRGFEQQRETNKDI